MMIDASVIEVSCDGEKLSAKLQGQERVAADWRPMLVLHIQVPETERACRTYYLGRKVRIEVKPQ